MYIFFEFPGRLARMLIVDDWIISFHFEFIIELVLLGILNMSTCVLIVHFAHPLVF